MDISFISLGKYLGAECLDQMVGVCLTSKKTVKLYSTCLYHVIFLSAVYGSSSFSISLPVLGMVNNFNFSYSNRYMVISYSGFNDIFLINDVNFYALICNLYMFFNKMPAEILFPSYVVFLNFIIEFRDFLSCWIVYFLIEF